MTLAPHAIGEGDVRRNSLFKAAGLGRCATALGVAVAWLSAMLTTVSAGPLSRPEAQMRGTISPVIARPDLAIPAVRGGWQPRIERSAPAEPAISYLPAARETCLPESLRRVLEKVAARFGPVVVSSTHRDRSHNARVGGASHSLHLDCRAVDFRVVGGDKGLWQFLKSQPDIGGLKRYAFGFYHIDDGPRRSW